MSIELENSFDVPVPPAQAWDVLLDVARVAPCMPGATVDEVDGDVVTGKIKIKVGPITMTYSGKATFTEKDPQARSVVVEAAGKETRGAGTASARVHARLDESGGQTRVVVQTSLNVTGRPAQFGRGVMTEVAGRLIDKFSANLAEQLASTDEAQPAASNSSGSDSRMAIPIRELNLSTRAAHTLENEGIATVGELVARTEDELLALHNLGEKSVGEIEERLGDLGLALREGPAPQTAASNGSGPHAGEAGPAAQAASPAGTTTETAAETAPPRPAAGLPREDTDEDDALNLLDVAAGPILKRVLPVAAIAAVLVWVGLRLRRRTR
jgi:carbon monoxide dehydrogenase subunit G